MQGQENKMFRQEVIERLSSPERLDEMMRVVNPKAWLPLAAMGSLVVVALLWSIFGRLPLTVAGQGVLIQPRRVVPFQSPGQGQVLKLNIKAGDIVKEGDVLLTIDQTALNQQLDQERAKLEELLAQNKNTNTLQNRTLTLERENLLKQKANLEQSLRREAVVPVLREKSIRLLEQNRASLERSLGNSQTIIPELRQKNLTALEQNRKSLQQRLQQVRDLLPSLQQRVESRQRLLEKQLITDDVMLQAKNEYFQNLAQLSDIEAQLKQLDVQEIDAQRQFLESLNSIDGLKTQLQEIGVQETNVQRDYLQSLNRLDEIRTRIEEIESQRARLAQQNLETSLNRTNQIAEVRRRIAQLELQLAEQGKIVSPYNGRVLEVAVVSGQIIGGGTRIGAIEAEDPDGQLMSVTYFSDKDGKQIKPGMTLQVTPSLVKRERYGGIVGEVTNVSPFPVSLQSIATTVGNEELAKTLAPSGAPVQVFAQLEKDPATASGYKWSSSKGPPLEITAGTTTQVKVKVAEVAPISYIIPIFRSWTGVY